MENNKQYNEIIELDNRYYGVHNYLELVDDNTYALRFSREEEGDYCRVGLAKGCKWEDNEYYFIDPSGGPFLSIGSTIKPDTVITRIYSKDNTYYIQVDKKEKQNGEENVETV